MTTNLRDAADAAMIQSFAAFLHWGFSALRPGERLVDARYLQAMVHALARVADGDGQRLLLTLPPRHLKSIMVSVLYPAWLLGRDPTIKFIVVSYSEELARDLSRMFRQVIEHPEYREVFPGTRSRQVTDMDVSTTESGQCYGVSLGGSITGLGADIIICDDLMRPEDAHSVQLRETALCRFDGTVSTRLNSPQEGAIIIVQQRLHEDDLVAHVLAGGSYKHLSFLLMATAEARFDLGGGRTWTRQVGDVLSPDPFDADTIERLRRDLGEPAFEAQYQQIPMPQGGGRSHLDRAAFFEPRPDGLSTAERLDRAVYPHVVQAWDVASGTKPENDYSVCTTWGYHQSSGLWHLLDLWQAKRDFFEARQMAEQLRRQWEADMVIVEVNWIGQGLYDELNRSNPEGMCRDAVRLSKDVRFEINIDWLYADTGEAALPRSAPWLGALLAKFRAFPGGRYKDQVDSVVLFLNWLRSGRGRYLIRRANRRPAVLVVTGQRRRRRRLKDSLTLGYPW